MSHDLFSSFASFDSSISSVLLVRDVAGDYRQVDADEVLQAAQQVLLGRMAVVHRLALRVVIDAYSSEGSPVNISASPQEGLDAHAPDLAQSRAAIGIREVRQAWSSRLPQDPDALFAELLASPQSELLSLLAVCVAVTVGAVTGREGDAPAALLAQAVGLDMHDWWTPTAAGYFEYVSKAKTLEAVQVFAPEQVNRLAKLKKAELASEAERLVTGTGWLPVMFRGAEEPDTEVQAVSAVEAEGTAADADHEQEPALA